MDGAVFHPVKETFTVCGKGAEEQDTGGGGGGGEEGGQVSDPSVEN